RLDGHAAAAPIPALAAFQLFGDGVEVEPEAGGHPFENRDETFPVRFTGGEKTQHFLVILYEVSSPSGLAGARSAAFQAHFGVGAVIAPASMSHAHAHRRSLPPLRNIRPGSRASTQRHR